MIDRLRLLALLNVIDCDCCQWEKVHDIADAIESGDAVFGVAGDQIIALHATLDGVRLLRAYPMVSDAAA
jgi:hypothetical protein